MDRFSHQSPVIEVQGLVKKFGFKSVLKDITFSLEKGDFLALFGPNGAGKTTLLKILCSLMTPTFGRVSVKGLDPKHDREELCKEVGVILDENFLYKNLSAYENLMFYGKLHAVDNLNQRITQLLEMVRLTLYKDEYVNTFSKGMLQRLSIARAIINNPSILFLDEPFNGLDQQGTEILRSILENFKKQGKTVIITSHDIEMGLELCNQVAILVSGYLIFKKSTNNICMEDFKRLYSDKIGGGLNLAKGNSFPISLDYMS